MSPKDMTPEQVQDIKRRTREQFMRDLMAMAERFEEQYGIPPDELRFVPIGLPKP